MTTGSEHPRLQPRRRSRHARCECQGTTGSASRRLGGVACRACRRSDLRSVRRLSRAYPDRRGLCQIVAPFFTNMCGRCSICLRTRCPLVRSSSDEVGGGVPRLMASPWIPVRLAEARRAANTFVGRSAIELIRSWKPSLVGPAPCYILCCHVFVCSSLPRGVALCRTASRCKPATEFASRNGVGCLRMDIAWFVASMSRHGAAPSASIALRSAAASHERPLLGEGSARARGVECADFRTWW